MKKLSFYALAIAGMLFTACSADRDVAADVNGSQNGGVEAEGYMSLNINLPTTPSMRITNDDFADGTANEYRVHDCGLLLFEGSDPNTAKFLNAQEISLPFNDEAAGGDKNITTTYVALAEVSGYTKTANPGLWALVVINYKNFIDIQDGGNVVFTTKIADEGDDETVTLTKNTTSALSTVIRALETNANLTTRIDKATNYTGDKDRYFFMTNAVLSTKQGGDKTVTEVTTPAKAATVIQLAYIDPLKIYHTEAEAKNGDSAGEILVERAVAKATLNWKEAKYGDTDDDNEYTEDDDEYTVEITDVKWVIDNTEPTTYILRNPGVVNGSLPYLNYASDASGIPTTDKYRFVGNATTKGTTGLGSTSDFYRIYWCVDPNYNEDAYTVGANGVITTKLKQAYYKDTQNKDNLAFVETGEDKPLYCYENTFDVDRQKYGNTTRAILKVTTQLKDKGGNIITDLYALNNDGKLYTRKAIDSRVAEKVIKNINFEKLLKDHLLENKEYAELTTENFGDYFTINYELSTEIPGKYEFVGVSYRTGVSGRDELFSNITISNDLNKDIADLVNTEISITKYENGVMYYEARFKHFGDEMTPWNSTESTKPTSGTEISDAYGSDADKAANNYLGRYGMVRNNWYDVVLKSILKPGYPTIASTKIEKPDTPDDNLDDYIKFEIHVLSWAKRTQNWGF